MLMVADVGEGGVSDLLMSAKKIIHKSCQNLHKKLSRNVLQYYCWLLYNERFSYNIFEMQAVHMHKNCLLSHLMNFKNIDCWWTKGS